MNVKTKIEDINEMARELINEQLLKLDSEYLYSDLSIELGRIIDTPKIEKQSIPRSNLSLLNTTLEELKIANHIKGRRYALEELHELGRVLDLYSNDHKKIQRALKLLTPHFRD